MELGGGGRTEPGLGWLSKSDGGGTRMSRRRSRWSSVTPGAINII